MKDLWRRSRTEGARVLIAALTAVVATSAPSAQLAPSSNTSGLPCEYVEGTTPQAFARARRDRIEELSRAVTAAPQAMRPRLDLARCQASQIRSHEALRTLSDIEAAFAAAPELPDDARFLNAPTTKKVAARFPPWRMTSTPALVIVETAVRPDGKVQAVTTVERGRKETDGAALKAAKQWRFVPAVENGVRVAFTTYVPILVSTNPHDSAVDLIDIARFLAARGRTRLALGIVREAIARLTVIRDTASAELRKCFGQSVPEIHTLAENPDATPAEPIRELKPKYTKEAMLAGISGTSELVAVVGQTGVVGCSWMTMPLFPGLDEAALTTTRQAAFTPMTIGGRPVTTMVTLGFSFQLR